MSGFATPFAHVDMDAFYVEVERLDDPSLRGVPVVVGGLGNRGVVAAASYEARNYGVHSAMPIVEARRRMPRARYLPPDMAKYSAMSARVFAILEEFTPHIEPLSVDEAFLDISGLRLHYSSPQEVAGAIRRRVRDELDLPASVGIAAVKFLAKMASKQAKPDGWFIVEHGSEQEFLSPMKVDELWGVGQATLASLQGLGIETIGQLAACPHEVLRRHLGVASASHLSDLAAGRDPRHVDTGRETKSVSVETTYSADLVEPDAIERALLELCHRLSGRLLHSHLAGKTVSLKIRFGDFTTLSRSMTRDQAIADTSQIWPVAEELLGKVDVSGRGVRLLGIGVSGLTEHEPTQLALDGSDKTALATATAEVRERFGDDAVLPARLAEGRRKKPEG
jgi:DNA polymerase-4